MRLFDQLPHGIKREIKGFLLLGLALLFSLALLTYREADSPFLNSSPEALRRNLIGPVGLYGAEVLFSLLGSSAFLLPLFLFALAMREFLPPRDSRSLSSRAVGAFLMLVSLSTFLSLRAFSLPKITHIKPGGLVGSMIGSWLETLLGRGGTEVLVMASLIISFLMAVQVGLIASLIKSSQALTALAGKTRGILSKLKEALISLRSLFREKARMEPEVVSYSDSEERSSWPEPKENNPFLTMNEEPVMGGDDAPQYVKPPLSLLQGPDPFKREESRKDLKANCQLLEETLTNFGIEAQVSKVIYGPTVTRYELKLAPGVKVNKVIALADDITLSLKAYTVRIEAPIPGKGVVGIEVPNERREDVLLKEILASPQFQNSPSKLTLALGKTIGGEPLVVDLAQMPHLLIAGTTGSGKTACINTIIASLLFNTTPDEVKLLLIDPKMVELSVYNSVPHLLCPVITEAKKVAPALNLLVQEMERRYKTLADEGERHIESYNQKVEREQGPHQKRLPYIVVIVDELADLMMVSSIEVEECLARLAQLARAVGIHLILATQRPSVDVVTGVIKANFPARLSFQVSSKVDSRTVLDINGAERLIGKGDMLFLSGGTSVPRRAQGAFLSDEEIRALVQYLRSQAQPAYQEEFVKVAELAVPFEGLMDARDEYYDEAVRVILSTGQASISMLQRKLPVGYARACRLMDAMEREGIVGPSLGSQPRQILVDLDYLQRRHQGR